MPGELYAELAAAAEARQTSVAVLIRASIRLGLLALELEASPDSALIARENGIDRVVVLS
jgi:hypothetical protein